MFVFITLLIENIKNFFFKLFFNKNYYVNFNFLAFSLKKIVLFLVFYIISFCYVLSKFLIKNVIFFLKVLIKTEIVKYFFKLVDTYILRSLEFIEFLFENKKVNKFFFILKTLFLIYFWFILIETLNFVVKSTLLFYMLISASSLILFNFLNVILKRTWKKTQEIFWAYVTWEIEWRVKEEIQLDASVDNLVANLNDFRDFILKFFFKIRNLVFTCKKNIKIFYKIWKKKRFEKFYFRLVIINIFWLLNIWFRRLKFKSGFARIYIYFIKDFNIKKVSIYFVLLILFLLILKYIKILLIFKMFSFGFLRCIFLYFKSYLLILTHFFIKVQEFFFYSKFNVRRNFFYRWFYRNNRFINKFKYKKNYFFSSNKYLRFRNRISRFYLRLKYIDKLKIEFAERIRKMCHINKKKRFLKLFFKVLPTNLFIYLLDKVYNYDVLVHVVDILKSIS